MSQRFIDAMRYLAGAVTIISAGTSVTESTKAAPSAKIPAGLRPSPSRFTGPSHRAGRRQVQVGKIGGAARPAGGLGHVQSQRWGWLVAHCCSSSRRAIGSPRPLVRRERAG